MNQFIGTRVKVKKIKFWHKVAIVILGHDPSEIFYAISHFKHKEYMHEEILELSRIYEKQLDPKNELEDFEIAKKHEILAIARNGKKRCEELREMLENSLIYKHKK